jgi:hypothetical protein
VPALSKGLGEVARQQGASAGEAQNVSAAVVKRAPLLAVPKETLTALALNPRDAAAAQQAVSAMTKVGLTQEQAVAQLQSLGTDPTAVSDLQLIGKYATVLQSAKAAIPASDLAYLQANGAEVTKAAEDSPHQWQTWWWVCIAGQVLFLPFVFVMAGRWSPRRAREDERAHEEMVQRELAALQGTGTAGSTA